MGLVDPSTPVYNTIIFYILIICILLILKPQFMYCEETDKFKHFGLSENQTIFSFPLIAIGSGIILYIIFLLVNMLSDRLVEN